MSFELQPGRTAVRAAVTENSSHDLPTNRVTN